MSKKKILIIILSLLVIAAITVGIIALCGGFSSQKNDTIRLSTKKDDNDFTDLYRTTESQAYSLAAVSIQKIETVQDIIEKYQTPETTYTKITASVEKDFTGYIGSSNITIYLLGNEKNFPNREIIKSGRQYLFRLENWVTENGIVYLISPLESLYYRIYNGNIMVHDDADSANYRISLSLSEFSDSFNQYRKEHPADYSALHIQHFKLIYDTLKQYDYSDKDLAYKPTLKVQTKRLENTEKIYNSLKAGNNIKSCK